MKVLYVDHGVNERAEREYGAKKVELDELLKTSDFVLLQAPLTAETRNLISTPQLKAMKRSAFLINASRGPIVDEPALVEALKDGTIAGAGLDVYLEEPLSVESPLLKMDNVVTLPHIGSATHETRRAMNKNAAENLIGALNGTLKVEYDQSGSAATLTQNVRAGASIEGPRLRRALQLRQRPRLLRQVIHDLDHLVEDRIVLPANPSEDKAS